MVSAEPLLFQVFIFGKHHRSSGVIESSFFPACSAAFLFFFFFLSWIEIASLPFFLSNLCTTVEIRNVAVRRCLIEIHGTEGDLFIYFFRFSPSKYFGLSSTDSESRLTNRLRRVGFSTLLKRHRSRFSFPSSFQYDPRSPESRETSEVTWF